MNTLTQYALGYAGVGVITLALLRLITWLKHRGEENFTVNLMKASDEAKPKESRFRKALKNLGIWGFALLIWPAAVAIVAADLFEGFRRDRSVHGEPDPELKFFAKGSLVRPITIEEAESFEISQDPRSKVPAIAFGHLNAGWKKFLAKKPSDEAQLWAFHRASDAGNKWHYDRANGIGRGYCWVLNEKVVAEIRVEGD